MSPLAVERLLAGRRALFETRARGPAALRSLAGDHARLADACLAELAGGDWGGSLCLAQGGHGRGALCPGSDLDLLFLFPEPPGEEAAAKLTRRLIRPLWDAGLRVDYSLRGLEECLDLASSDPKVAAELLDARPLPGQERSGLVRDLRLGLTRRVDPGAFRDWLLERRRPYSLLSPDLKMGRGGWRDAASIGWLARLSGRPVPPLEAGALDRAEAMLVAARWALHLQRDKPAERLEHPHHRAVAQAMGFAGEEVPWMLGELHRAMETVHLGLESVLYGRAPSYARLRSFPRLCGLLADGPPPGLAEREAIRSSLSRTARLGPESQVSLDALLDLLAAPNGWERACRLLDLGGLDGLLPEFTATAHFTPMDGLHELANGRHALRTAARLAAPDDDTPRTVREMLPRAGSRRALVLAGLLHDAAKGGEEHEHRGADLARVVLGRLGEPEGVIEEVAFLVERHLLLPLAAQRGDPSDETSAARAAALCGSPERLASLAALAAADGSATGPRAWGDWQEHLLGDFVRRALAQFTSGALAEPHAAETILRRRDRFRVLAPDKAEAERFLDAAPPRYLLRTPAEEMAAHLDLYRDYLRAAEEDRARRTSRFAGLGLVVQRARDRLDLGAVELTIVAPDQPRLFAMLCGACGLHGASILEASAHTFSPGGQGMALDVFLVEPPPAAAEEFGERVARDVRWAATGKLDLAYRLAQKRASPLAPGPDAPAPGSVVRLSDGEDGAPATIEVEAGDRLGRLFDLASVLADFDLRILWARASTSEGRIGDVFRVRGPQGASLGPPALREELRRALLDVLAE
ncbi:HD domain-containing protein [Desulfohalovibrio reitneri]|uniref:[protein-PII] uridylyltransferase family protein n=1 Tax=Desulfohalovibrio reitneri TaxID=1307759 RepID=UPI00054EC628|nr:HD domain-containing protein [Desulfohalovibrio reitneri]